MLKAIRHLTYASMFVLVLFVFVSFSITAGHHILIALPGVYFLARAIQKKNFSMSASMWSLLALIIVSALSILVNDGPIKNIFNLKYYLLGILAIFAYRDQIENALTEKKIKILMNIFFIATAFASLVGVYALFTGFNPVRMKPAAHPTRASGLYGMCMSYAYGMGFVLISSIGILANSAQVKKYLSPKLHWVSFLSNLLGFILSAARGSILGLIGATPLAFLHKGKKWIIGIYAIGLLGLAGIIGFTSFGHKVFLERLTSDSLRWSQFQASFRMFQEKPILGWGYKTTSDHIPAIKQKYDIGGDYEKNFTGHAHNNFLEHLASTGLLGFLALLAFHFFWAFEMFKRKDLIGQITIPFIGYLFISGQVQYTFGDGENTFLIMFIYGLSQAIPRIKNELLS